MKYFAGMMTIVVLVAVATVGGYRAWDKATHTRDDNGGVLSVPGSSDSSPTGSVVPGQNQVIVAGSVTSARIEGAAVGPLATPFTVTPDNRGVGGATFTPVDVDGQQTSIDWQTGQPLPLEGDGGSVNLDGVTCVVGDGAINLELVGVYVVAPGAYRIGTSVAVGSQPRDSVTFTATDKTTVEFRGGANTPYPTPDAALKGTGNVMFEGALRVVRSDGSKSTMSSISLDSGAFDIKLTPTGNGDYTVAATLQGITR
jgi:hypothetical protein